MFLFYLFIHFVLFFRYFLFSTFFIFLFIFFFVFFIQKYYNDNHKNCNDNDNNKVYHKSNVLLFYSFLWIAAKQGKHMNGLLGQMSQ